MTGVEGRARRDRVADVAKHLQAGGFFDPGLLREEPVLASAGAVLDERFELRARLGQGSAGVVWRAFDRRTQRDVALKLLLHTEGTGLERFLRESELAASLAHEGIVRVFESGELEGGRRYLVSEFVEGGTLAEALPNLSLEARLRSVREVVAAVAHAHEHGVVHRDLKPGNVLLDASGRARVTDFGVSYRPDLESLTASGVGVGTPSFMAPEQLMGEDGRRDPTVDVWALGVLLYLCLADRLPFEAPDAISLSVKLGQAKPASLAKVAPHSPAWIRRVCARCLHKSPQRRYPDARALEAALAAPPPAQGAPSWAVVGVTALLFGLAGLTWAATRTAEGKHPPAQSAPRPTPVPAPPVNALPPRTPQTLPHEAVDPVPSEGDEFSHLIKRGKQLHEEGRDVEARDSLQRALDLRPTAVELVPALTDLYAKTGQAQRARELVESHLRAWPDYFELWCALAQTNLREGDLAAAETALSEAERRAPSAHAVLLHRCYLELLRGNPRLARYALDELAEQKLPTQVARSRDRCEAVWCLQVGQPDRALSLLKALPDDDSPMELYARGEAARQLGQRETARELLRAYVEEQREHQFVERAKAALRELE